MGEPFPPQAGGNQEPLPLTPEQERVQRAGMVYMRYLCGRLEGELYPPEGMYRTALRNDVTPEYMLIAMGNERSLKVHSAPDDAGFSREITYSTRISQIGYTGTPQDEVYVQVGSPMQGASPNEPLTRPDLDFLDGFLARKLPIPEVIDAVRRQVGEILNPPQPDDQA
ncbi:MAG TPA: hypothetical protein VLE99_03355 [Candidatus Saccharimonadales bacterium]|nr:hypothetical protein [Candidatus Saccharimonadales bacterium]